MYLSPSRHLNKSLTVWYTLSELGDSAIEWLFSV